MAWGWVQSASATASASTTVAATFASNVTAGNKIIVAVAMTGTAITSVKDGAGNTWTLIASETMVASNGFMALYALDVPAGDAGTKPTLTATFATNDASILIQEVSGLLPGNTTAMADGTAGVNTGNTNTTAGSGAYSSTAANEYLVAVYGDTGGPLTWTVPAGYTADTHSVNSSSVDDIAIGYKNSSNGAESATWSLSGTATAWGTILIAFKLSASAVPAPPQPGSRTWRARFRRGQVPWPPPATVPAPPASPAQPPALLKGAPAAVKGTLTGVAAPPPVAAPPGSGPAVLPQPGSRSWRARFRRRQAPSAPLGLAPSAPSPFFAPHTLLQGPAAAGRSELFHVEAPPPVRPGPPAPFHPPHVLLQGPAARVLARLTGARGRPGVPAPFTPPRLLSRGPAAAVKGTLTGLAAPPPARHLTLGGFPLRGPAAARKGTLSGVVAPPPVLHPVVVSTFKVPGFPLRGPAAAVKGTVAGVIAPPPVVQPNVPSPFYAPHVPLRGPVPVASRTKTTGAVAPPPAPPPLAPPHWQGSTHMIAATATGNLIQGANHTGRGGPGSDLKGDYERSGD
jgi:hypothetical protein